MIHHSSSNTIRTPKRGGFLVDMDGDSPANVAHMGGTPATFTYPLEVMRDILMHLEVFCLDVIAFNSYLCQQNDSRGSASEPRSFKETAFRISVVVM